MAPSMLDTEAEIEALLRRSDDHRREGSRWRPFSLCVICTSLILMIGLTALWLGRPGRGTESASSLAPSGAIRPQLLDLSVEHHHHHRPLSKPKQSPNLGANKSSGSATKDKDTTKLLGTDNEISEEVLREEIENKTDWVERFDLAKNLEFLSSEVTSMTECLEVRNGSMVSNLHPCYMKMLQEHTQRGLIVPLEEFQWPAPSPWAYIVSGLVVVILLTLASLVALVVPLVFMTGLRPAVHLIPTLTPEGLRGECILQQAQPLLLFFVALAVGFGLERTSEPSPAILIPLIFAPALRLAAVDVRLFMANEHAPPSHQKRWFLRKIWHFLASKLDVLNASSNGVVLAIVWLMEHHGSQTRHAARIAAAWDGSISAWVLPLMGHRHSLSCAMLAIMLLSSTLELGFTSRLHRISDFCGDAGLGLTLSSLRQDGRQIVELGHDDTFQFHEKLVWTIPKLLARVFFEAIPQLFLQGSAIMLSDEGLFDRPVLTLSVALSYAAGCAKSTQLLGTLRAAYLDGPCQAQDRHGLSPFLLEVGLAGLGLLAVNLGFFRLLLAETCESHIWGLSTGCVVAPSLK